MGFGQYCANCHASARNNSTFSALKNIKGLPGEPLVFLSQNFFIDPSWQSLQMRMKTAGAKYAAAADHDPNYFPAVLTLFWSPGGPPTRLEAAAMPSQSHDSLSSKPDEPVSRRAVDAFPNPRANPVAAPANYGAPARNGISCTSCHHRVLGKADTEKYQHEPQNTCIPAQQQAANPGLTGFAATFTGN